MTLPLGGAGVDGRASSIARKRTSIRLLNLSRSRITPRRAMTITSPDANLGAAPPVADTSGLTQPNGQVPAGATSIIVANPVAFAGGGRLGRRRQRRTGDPLQREITTSSLTGIPATGPGALVASGRLQLDDHGGAGAASA